MSNALADPVVHGHKRPFRRQPVFHGPCNPLRHREQRSDLGERKIRQCLDVGLGNQQAVSGKQRPVVEEHQRVVVFENHGRRPALRGDLTKEAFGGHVPIMPGRALV